MRFKVKTPKSLIGWIILLLIIAVIILPFTGLIEVDIQDVFFYLLAAILSWSFIILFAIIGAIFLGMFLSHRILSIGGFTPFEEEMLKMREDINAINKMLDSLMAQNNPGENLKEEDNKDDED
jgi:hypothetical protein